MGITFEEVEENGLLTPSVLACIPRTCECGAPIEFTDSLRQIYCSNPRCLYKVAARLESMGKAMKSDGWGESTCITVCREFGVISPYQVFLLPGEIKKGKTSSVAAFEKKVASICDPAKRRVKLWEVVKLAGIPSIETTAYKIFDGYNSLDDAYEDIENGQVPFIAEKLGLKNSENSVMAVTIYNTLIQYKEELKFGESQFTIVQPTGKTIYIAITGGVYGFKNKSEFVSYINSRYSGKVNAMLMSRVTSQIDILIADGDTSHGKYAAASKINAKYVETGLNTGMFTEDQMGTFENDTDMHPIGEKIFITDSEGVLARLDKIFNN